MTALPKAFLMENDKMDLCVYMRLALDMTYLF